MRLSGFQFLFFATAFCVGNSLFALGYPTSFGSRSQALGSSGAVLKDQFSVVNSPSLMAYTGELSVAFSYARPWMITGYNEMAAAVAYPVQSMVFGLSLQQSGITGYAEQCYGLVLARRFGQKLAVGMQFNYFLIDFPESGEKRGTLVFNGGVAWEIARNSHLSIHLNNPFRRKIEASGLSTMVPSGMAAGISTMIDEDILLVGQIEKTANMPLALKVGVEYRIVSCLFIRGGISARPLRHAFGIGCKIRSFFVDIAARHHEQLGYTPSFSLAFSLSK